MYFLWECNLKQIPSVQKVLCALHEYVWVRSLMRGIEGKTGCRSRVMAAIAWMLLQLLLVVQNSIVK